MKPIIEKKLPFHLKLPKIGAVRLPRVPKKLFLIPLILVLLLAVLGAAIALPLLDLYRSTNVLKDHVKYLKDGVLLQNMTQVKRGMEQIGDDAALLQKKSKRLSFTKFIPFVGMYYSDLKNAFSAANRLTKAASVLVEAIYPNANLIGFSTDEKAAQPLYGPEKIKALIIFLPKLAAGMDGVGEEISLAAKDLKKIDSSRYPKALRGKAIRSQLDSVKASVSGLAKSYPDIKLFMEKVPEIAGVGVGKRYLVLFQNDKEIRPTGGFWTAYAIFNLSNGQIAGADAGDMYMLDIDGRAGAYPAAPWPIKTYLKLDEWYIRDSNLSPDFKESTDTLMQFWRRVPGVGSVDGVFAVDTFFVQGLLDVLGDVSIPGYGKPFTKDNVVHELELYANVLRKMEKGRKDILGALMNELINKAYGMPSGKYDDFLKKLSEEAIEKHLIFRFFDEETQKLAEDYNVAGRIKDFGGDYLHINDANFGGRKANWWITEVVTQDVRKVGDHLEKTVTIDYENTGDYDAEWNTGYRDYVRVYVPKGAKLLEGSGGRGEISTSEDLGKTVFSAYMAVNPKQKATLKLRYELPVSVYDGKKYRLLVQKQPGTDGFQYIVNFGSRREKFLLKTDKEVIF